jgi:hypothetical protein
MASLVPTAVAPELGVEGPPDRIPDLRELVQSVTSLGSYGLRWQLFESAARWTAACEGR